MPAFQAKNNPQVILYLALTLENVYPLGAALEMMEDGCHLCVFLQMDKMGNFWCTPNKFSLKHDTNMIVLPFLSTQNKMFTSSSSTPQPHLLSLLYPTQ